MIVKTAARDRHEYLRRPDFGRKLDPQSRDRLRRTSGPHDVVFVVADGLSALAVHRHAAGLLRQTLPQLDPGGWKIAPVAIVEQGRVAVADEIGYLLGASLAVILIGERPGLSSPDSLGVYLTWSPCPGRTEAERNCISNVRSEGLSTGAAAELLLLLMREARAKRISGIKLGAGITVLAE